MLKPVLIAGGALGMGLMVVLFVAHGPLRTWASHPVLLRRGHLIALAVAMTLPACTAMVVSLAGRVKLNSEIRTRLAEDTARITQDQLTRDQIAGIAQAQARLLQPSTREQLRRINMALRTCASHSSCRVAFVQTVNRIVRSPAGRSFTVAPPKAAVVAPPPAAAPVTVTKTVIVPAPAAVPGKPGKPGRDGAAGAPGKDVNSALLDGLDNRLANVEQGLARVVQALCVPALLKLLKLVGVCA
jgi:hypothetical protein